MIKIRERLIRERGINFRHNFICDCERLRWEWEKMNYTINNRIFYSNFHLEINFFSHSFSSFPPSPNLHRSNNKRKVQKSADYAAAAECWCRMWKRINRVFISFYSFSYVLSPTWKKFKKNEIIFNPIKNINDVLCEWMSTQYKKLLIRKITLMFFLPTSTCRSLEIYLWTFQLALSFHLSRIRFLQRNLSWELRINFFFSIDSASLVVELCLFFNSLPSFACSKRAGKN